jgi:translation initiation factor 1
MSKKSKGLSSLVYSTDPNFKPEEEQEAEHTLPPSEQSLRVMLDKKNRGGKVVTVVRGFVGTNSDLEELGRKLKTYCGTGGSAKEGEIIVQGDNRVKIGDWLQKAGYKVRG